MEPTVDVADRARRAGEARDAEIEDLLDSFAATAMRLSLVEVELVELVQGLLAHAGAIRGTVPSVLALRAGMSGAEAKKICRVAKRLRDLPRIDAAFRAGRLSMDTTDVLLKCATVDNEQVLLDTAAGATGAQLRTIMRAFRQVRDHDAPPPDTAESVAYGLGDPLWSLTARLLPGHGAELEAALRAARDAIHDSWRSPADADHPGGDPGVRPPVTTAEALVHLGRSFLAGTVTEAGHLPEQYLTIVHLELGAEIREKGDAGAPPATAAGGGIREKRGDEPQARFGAGGPDVGNPNDIASLRGMGAIDGPTLNTALCHTILSIVSTRQGVPVDVTRDARAANRAQRRALASQHRTCQFPGCGRTQFLQAHHVIEHQYGGPTAYFNLALVCDEHHDVLHLPGWSAALSDDHTLLVWDPAHRLLNTGALRPDRVTSDHAQFAKFDTSTSGLDIRQRVHGVGEPLTAYALDVYLQTWLEATAA